jgi:hypothetical protein
VLDSVIGSIISRISELQNYINRKLDDKCGIISVHVRTVRQKRQSTSWCMIFECGRESVSRNRLPLPFPLPRWPMTGVITSLPSTFTKAASYAVVGPPRIRVLSTAHRQHSLHMSMTQPAPSQKPSFPVSSPFLDVFVPLRRRSRLVNARTIPSWATLLLLETWTLPWPKSPVAAPSMIPIQGLGDPGSPGSSSSTSNQLRTLAQVLP